MQTAITQAAIQAATVAVKVLKEQDIGPTTGTNVANTEEAHRPRHGRPALRQPTFNWKAPDKYAELLNFEMEVLNILYTRAYELNDEEKVPI